MFDSSSRPQIRAEEPVAALSIIQVAAPTYKPTEFNPTGPDQQLTERFSVDSTCHRIRPWEPAARCSEGENDTWSTERPKARRLQPWESDQSEMCRSSSFVGREAVTLLAWHRKFQLSVM